MIKRIEITALRVGMYIHDLDCKWTEHPFFSTSFAVDSETTLKQVCATRVHHLFIDTDKGLDAEPEQPAANKPKPGAKAPGPSRPTVPAIEELEQSKAVFSQATGIIKNLMHDARLGKQVETTDLEPITESLVQSAFRNHYALTGICRMKNKDEYTFMHCVSVAGLLIAFGRDMGMGDNELHELALGGLLHDIGKSMIPNEILNKPGKLDVDEFEIMKGHVNHSGEIIKDMQGLGQIPIDVTMLHHEKIDGSGYPLGLKGDEISQIGKMSAIADVYDALTSERVYKAAWQPTATLKSMIEWSPTNLSRELVERFVRCLGIYPVGSAVQLASGLIAVIIDQTEDLLRPQIRTVFNARKDRPTPIRDIDLTKELLEDRVEHIIDPGKYGINVNQIL